MAAFPARTFPVRDAGRAWEASAADYFSRSSGSRANYDPASSSWRTSQLLLFEAQSELLGNFAASGMTVDGEFFPLRMWARITDGNGGGFWPTPSANQFETCDLGKMLDRRARCKEKQKNGNGFGLTLANAARMWPTPNVPNGGRSPKGGMSRTGITPDGKKRQVGLENAVKMWPTPTVQDSENDAGASQFKRNSIPLNAAVKMFPTPRAAERNSYQQKGDKSWLTLTGAAKLWPTPRACDADKNIRTPEGRVKERLRRKNGEDLPTAAGGQLNPTWVEWLMGYPSEWTALEDWATQWFRPKREKPLKG